MHKQYFHGLINFFNSFCWNNLILCLYNLNTLDICIRKFDSDKIIFDRMAAVRT